MEESTELKAGMTATYTIGEKTVTLKPVTLGKMKKAMAAFLKKDTDAFDMMLDALVEILANGQNDFATREWLEQNVTLPEANRIISDMRTVNGMGDGGFFQAGGAKAAAKEVRDLPAGTATPSA